MSTLLLSYQVAIWLATDAPLLAFVTVALLGMYWGFYAADSRRRVRGYTLMHLGLAAAFLSKSAAGWLVPGLALATLIAWERRWRELLRWELYCGTVVQMALILPWIFFVHAGPDGTEHLRVFFWNNLVGRFTRVAAAADIQYTAGHQNQPGKYLTEMPLYLWPWTLLVIAAVSPCMAPSPRESHGIATAAFRRCRVDSRLAALVVRRHRAQRLPCARPPGVALLLGWWASDTRTVTDRWDTLALRATAVMLMLALVVAAAATTLIGMDSWDTIASHAAYITITAAGLLLSATLAIHAFRTAGSGAIPRTYYALLLAYCALLIGPMSQVYERVDGWQDLEGTGIAIRRDAVGRNLILFAPDETTQAFVDMYTSTSVTVIPSPADAVALDYLRQELTEHPYSVVLAKLPSPNARDSLRALRERFGLSTKRSALVESAPGNDSNVRVMPAWVGAAGLVVLQRYDIPHGRSYALFQPQVRRHDSCRCQRPWRESTPRIRTSV